MHCIGNVISDAPVQGGGAPIKGDWPPCEQTEVTIRRVGQFSPVLGVQLGGWDSVGEVPSVKHEGLSSNCTTPKQKPSMVAGTCLELQGWAQEWDFVGRDK